MASRVLALSLLGAALLPGGATGAGMSTHSMVGERALAWFSSPSHPEYRSLLLSGKSFWQPGTYFSDWGYNCRGFSNEAETAHWPPFINHTAAMIRTSRPRPWDRETEGLVAFLFGIMSHALTDDSWHSLGMYEGLVEAIEMAELVEYGEAHTMADLGAEFVLKFMGDLEGNAELRWDIPSASLVEAYASFYPGGTAATEEDIEFCTKIGYVGLWANQLFGDLALPLAKRSPLLMEEYQNYFLGGLDDTAAWTSRCWEDLARWLEGDGPVRPMCPMLENQWGKGEKEAPRLKPRPHLSPEEAAAFLEAHGYRVISSKRGGVFSLELQREDGADPLAHHASEVRRRLEKLEALELLEEQQEEGLPSASRADPLAECVKEDQLPPAQHSFNTEAPYSQFGHAMVSGDFNGDGLEDLAVAAPAFGTPGMPQLGAVYILYGRRNQKPSAPLLSAIEKSADLILKGEARYSRFGYSLAVVDLNRDGIADLAVSAPTFNGLEMYYDGRVYVFAGSASGLSSSPLLTVKTDQPFPELDPGRTHAFKFVLLGQHLQSGDADGDGHADLIVGSPLAAPHGEGHQRGMVSLFYSSSRHVGLLDVYRDADLELVGEEDYNRFGAHTLLLPSFEGRRLLLVGANYYADGDSPAVGKLYGYDLSASSSLLFTITGDEAHQKFASSFVAGDFYGQGQTLLAVSCMSETYGRKWQAGGLRVVSLSGLSGDHMLNRVETAAEIQGGENAAHFSWSMAASTGNSSNSLWVSEPLFGNFRADEKASTGVIYEYRMGSAFPEGTVRNRVNAASQCVLGKEIRGRFGHAMVSLDLNGDSAEDLVVSSVHSSSGSSHSGTFTVFYG